MQTITSTPSIPDEMQFSRDHPIRKRYREQDERTPRQKATDQAALSLETADALHAAIIATKPDNWNELANHEMRLRACNQLDNIWHAEDLHDPETGVLFNGAGRLWRCNSKLCASCVSQQSKRHRRLLEQIIDVEKRLNLGEYVHFVTFTMPNEGLPLLVAREVMDYAWSLFRKRDWFKQHVIGGCKSEEFTVTSKGIHYHMHSIMKTRYIRWREMRAVWTECVKAAWLKVVMARLSVRTADGLVVVNVARLGNMANAIPEVAKYITKASSWEKLDQDDLIELASVERYPRMFEVFGSFRATRIAIASERASVDEARQVSEDEAQRNRDYLDTNRVSDGDISPLEAGERDFPHWRAMRAGDYAKYLLDHVAETTIIRREALKRRFPYAKLFQIKADVRLRIDDLESIAWKCQPPLGESWAHVAGSDGVVRLTKLDA